MSRTVVMLCFLEGLFTWDAVRCELSIVKVASRSSILKMALDEASLQKLELTAGVANLFQKKGFSFLAGRVILILGPNLTADGGGGGGGGG